MSDPQQNVQLVEEVGGKIRHHKNHHTAKTHKNVLIVGKVYADWCGHCQTLKPEWAKMKKHIHHKKGKRNVIYEEIEEKQIDSKLRKLEKDHNVKINVKGYPTVFEVKNGKVKYYEGPRHSDQMANWYLKGGDSEQQQDQEPMPQLMQDQQGGRRFPSHRFSYRRSSYRRFPSRRFPSRRSSYRRFPYHKSNYKTLRNDKSTGIFEFLFGK